MDLGNTKILELVARKEQLLKEHPELEKVQELWDNTMKRAGSQHNRLVMGSELMKSSCKLLQEKLDSLSKDLNNLAEFFKR